MGHVPAGPVREERESVDLPRRQHRGARVQPGDLTSSGRRRHVGALGERIAAAFLLGHGCRILARNLHIGSGELDLIASDGGRRFVVEVKTVTGAAGRAGSDAVDAVKEAQLRRLAGQLDPPVHRIDVVEVLLDDRGASIRWLRWV